MSSAALVAPRGFTPVVVTAEQTPGADREQAEAHARHIGERGLMEITFGPTSPQLSSHLY
jgi:hypothetical protein